MLSEAVAILRPKADKNADLLADPWLSTFTKFAYAVPEQSMAEAQRVEAGIARARAKAKGGAKPKAAAGKKVAGPTAVDVEAEAKGASLFA